MEEQARQYISVKYEKKSQNRPWVSRKNVFESQCEQCKDVSEVYKIFLIYQANFTLCFPCISDHYLRGLVPVRKTGEAYTYHPAIHSKERKRKKKWWSLYFFCPNCSLDRNSIFSGYSTPINGTYEFLGDCNHCGYSISGNTYDLMQQGKQSHKLNLENKEKKIELSEKEIKAKNAQSIQEYAEEFFKNIQNKRGKKKESVKKPENTNPLLGSPIKLFCSICQKVMKFDPLDANWLRKSKDFSGICRGCQQLIEGDIEVLENNSQFDSEEFNLRREKEIEAKDTQSIQGYAEEFFRELEKKLRKKS